MTNETKINHEYLEKAVRDWIAIPKQGNHISFGEEVFDGYIDLTERLKDLKAENERLREWKPIDENVTLHEDILFFREDAGVFLGRYTYMADWLVDENSDNIEDFTEEDLWDVDYWLIDEKGATRLSKEERPTHWKPLPTPPKQD